MRKLPHILLDSNRKSIFHYGVRVYRMYWKRAIKIHVRGIVIELCIVTEKAVIWMINGPVMRGRHLL